MLVHCYLEKIDCKLFHSDLKLFDLEDQFHCLILNYLA